MGSYRVRDLRAHRGRVVVRIADLILIRIAGQVVQTRPGSWFSCVSPRDQYGKPLTFSAIFHTDPAPVMNSVLPSAPPNAAFVTFASTLIVAICLPCGVNTRMRWSVCSVT